MEDFRIEKDIHVFCVRAKSFPEGILQAHQTLHSLLNFDEKRGYFAASRPENGQIVYWAGCTELSKGECKKIGLEPLTIQAGNYKSVNIQNYKKDISQIAKVFQQLKTLPEIDPQGYCVEEILNENDLRCMVRVI